MTATEEPPLRTVTWRAIPDPPGIVSSGIQPGYSQRAVLMADLDAEPVVAVCGSCGCRLAEGSAATDELIAVRCPRCGAFNGHHGHAGWRDPAGRDQRLREMAGKIREHAQHREQEEEEGEGEPG